MVGEHYWSVGIVIRPETWPNPRRWHLRVEFVDHGFVNPEASEGTLRMRYYVEHLEYAAKVLVADAERLGIKWHTQVPNCPTVFVEDDVEAQQPIANALAEALGWEPCYTAGVDRA